MGLLDNNGLAIAHGLDSFMRAYNTSQDRKLRREEMAWKKDRQGMLDDLTRKQFQMTQDQYRRGVNRDEANAQLAANPGLLSSLGEFGPFLPGQGLTNMPSAEMIWKVQEASKPKDGKWDYRDGQYHYIAPGGVPVAWGERYEKPPSTVVNNNLPGQQKSEDKAYGTFLVEDYRDNVRAPALAAMDELNSLSAMSGIDFKGGPTAEGKAWVANLAKEYGIPVPENWMSNAVSIDSYTGLVNKIVLTKAESMKGNLSDKDIRFLVATVPNVSIASDARKFLIDVSKAGAMRRLEKDDFFRNYKAQHKTFDGASSAWRKHIENRPLFKRSPKGLPVNYYDFRQAGLNKGMDLKSIDLEWMRGK